MNAGHIYGKVVDAKTNKGIDGVSLQLIGNRFDSTTRKTSPYTLRAGITQPNGDFDFDQLPVMGTLTLRVTAIGYKDVVQTISFGVGGRGRNGAGQAPTTTGDQGNMMENMMSMIDKDLGNIKLEATETTLENVTVTSVKQLFEMGVDRKVFNVDRNIVSQGQTATEVMKQIPSISVDIDGNVTMRNATPQLFIDGRPTTLTLDQIPADIIDRVELITNPSARFDASGGNAGILNIVLKKNKRIGYNGGLRFGIDSRGKVNTGGDINLRQGKLNFFVSGMYNQRLSKSTSFTNRKNLYNDTAFVQNSTGESEGSMAFIRGGFDYLADNRNTFTLSGNVNRGKFANVETQLIDSTNKSGAVSNSNRSTVTDANFKNWGTQFSYKHNFTKAGHEWTADVNYNSSTNDNTGNFVTRTYNQITASQYPNILQNSIGGGKSTNLVLQTDYDNPINDKKKFEAGARVQIRDFENANSQSFFNYSTGTFVTIPSISSNYQYTDKVYAGYATYGVKVKNWSYQFGLRAESSIYNGHLAGKDSAFEVKFPISLFPSVFITNKLNDQADIQLNYSRRINRPNFFQLMPFIDFSDPQNLNVGNAGLKPEFTNALEVSYSNNYKKGANFLASAYAKYNTDLITRYQYKAPSPLEPTDSVIFNTYANANESFTYGIELTNRMPIVKNWDMTVNFNLFNSSISGNILGQELKQQRTSWFVKWNNTIKLPKSFTIQLSGDYYAKTVLPQEGGRGGRGGQGGGGGGMMFGGGQPVTAQGYILPRYSFDIGIRKEWQIKGGNTLSANLSMNDFLKTQKFGTHSESIYFIQETERRRDPQVLRLNLQWRFGKFDANLFKRRNNRTVDEGGVMPNM
jgi:outer membrane receptor protein involved in Fe transport